MPIELADRVRISAEQCEMSINGLDRSEFRIGDEPLLGLAICRREKHSYLFGADLVLNRK